MRDADAPLHMTIGLAFKDSIKRGFRVVSAAKDPVGIPTDPAIVEIARQALCHLGLGTNCFTLTNVYGMEIEVPYGATVEQWRALANKFLKTTMENENAS
jgi:hypothetical protein